MEHCSTREPYHITASTLAESATKIVTMQPLLTHPAAVHQQLLPDRSPDEVYGIAVGDGLDGYGGHPLLSLHLAVGPSVHPVCSGDMSYSNSAAVRLNTCVFQV